MPKTPDRRKYINLILGRRRRKDWMQDLSTIRTARLHAVAKMFALNTARVHALALALCEIAFSVRHQQWCMDYASFVKNGRVEPPFTSFTPSPAVTEEYNRQIMHAVSTDPDIRSQQMIQWGAVHVGVMEKYTLGMDVSIHALLASVVIESWISFERLVSDLWTVAVDYGPSILRQRVMLKTLKAEKSDDPLDMTEVDDIAVDPRKKFGSAYRQGRKVSFQRMAYIIKNYDITFGHSIKPIFKSHNCHILALSAFRNALIHNGGKIDATFVKQVAECQDFKHLRPRHKLPLNGEVVGRLRDAGEAVGAKLLHFVDDVMTPP